MNVFDDISRKKENVFFSDSQILLGLRISLSFNFSDLKFVSSESHENLSSKALSVVHFLSGCRAEKIRKKLFLDEKKFAFATAKFFLPYRSFNKSQILIEENGFYWAFNFSEHVEIFSFCHECAACERLMDNLISMRENINSFSPLAYSKDFGFLSENPVFCGNMATIVAALHLPALRKSGKILNMIKEAEFLKMRLVPLFNDLPDTSGFYQINVSGGFLDERIFLKKTDSFLQAIFQREKEEREKFLTKNEFIDESFRALGILKHCRLLGFYEGVHLLSCLKTGADAGFFTGIRQGDIPAALTAFAPGIIDYLSKETNYSQNYKRAEIARDIFKTWCEKNVLN